MGLYENIQKAAEMRGISVNQLEKDLGLPRSSIAKYNAHVPSVDKINKIASYLHVSIDSLVQDEGYYSNPDTAAKAQELFSNPDLRMLFDAAKDSRPEDLQMVADMLRRFKEGNPNG